MVELARKKVKEKETGKYSKGLFFTKS